MTCLICKHGQTRPGLTSVVLQRNECTVIFKAVPADICENCGEYYLDEQTAQSLYDRADAATRSGAEVEILRFAA